MNLDTAIDQECADATVAELDDKADEVLVHAKAVCDQLDLRPDLTKEALQRLQAVLAASPQLAIDEVDDATGQGHERIWVACVLYLTLAFNEKIRRAQRLRRRPHGARSQLPRRGRRRGAQPVSAPAKLPTQPSDAPSSSTTAQDGSEPAPNATQPDSPESGSEEEPGSVLLEDVLRETRVSVTQLHDNVKSALEASRVVWRSPNSPRTRRARTDSFGSAPAGYVQPFEKQVVHGLELLHLSRTKAEILFQKFQGLWRASSGFLQYETPESSGRQALEFAWVLFVLALKKLNPTSEDDGDIAWSYKLLVAVILFTRFMEPLGTTPLDSDAVGANGGTASPPPQRTSPAARFSSAKDIAMDPLAVVGTGTKSARAKRRVSLKDPAVVAGSKRPRRDTSSGSRGEAENICDEPSEHKRGNGDANEEQGLQAREPVDSPAGQTSMQVFSPLGTPTVDRLIAFSKMERSAVMEMVQVLKGMVDELQDEGVLSNANGGSGTEASVDGAHEALEAYYVDHYLWSVSQFNPLTLLDSSKLKRQSFTPVRQGAAQGARQGPVNASAEHKRSKEETDAARAADRVSRDAASRVNKSLFSSSDDSLPPTQDDSDEWPTPPTPTGRRGIPRHPASCASPQRPWPMSASALSQAGTPVSSAIETSNWLSRELDGAPDAPSEALMRYFRACDDKLVEAILARLNLMRSQVEQAYRSRVNTAISKELFRDGGDGAPGGTSSSFPASALVRRRSPSPLYGVERYLELGKKLYFRVLESILHGESSRLQTKKFDALLGSDMFHRALFACCMEAIFRSKEASKLMYPYLTRCLEVPAFELLKVVESFIRFIPMLPRLLGQHMFEIETDILEEAAWVSGSPVFELLAQRKAGRGASSSDTSTQQISASAGATAPAANLLPLDLFLRKVIGLAHDRLKRLFVALGFKAHTHSAFFKDLWEIFRTAINQHPELLRDRHLDHVILCTIYGVSRVRRIAPEVSFKRLLTAYRNTLVLNNSDSYSHILSNVSRGARRPRNQRIAHDIPLDDGTMGDLVAFYNKAFMPRLKVSILNLRTKAPAAPTTPTSPRSSGQSASASSATPPRRPASSEHATSAFSSPSRSTDASKVDMTPRTRSLYAFRESPALGNALAGRGSGTGAGLLRDSLSDGVPRLLRSSSRTRIRNLMQRTASGSSIGRGTGTPTSSAGSVSGGRATSPAASSTASGASSGAEQPRDGASPPLPQTEPPAPTARRLLTDRQGSSAFHTLKPSTADDAECKPTPAPSP